MIALRVLLLLAAGAAVVAAGWLGRRPAEALLTCPMHPAVRGRDRCPICGMALQRPGQPLPVPEEALVRLSEISLADDVVAPAWVEGGEVVALLYDDEIRALTPDQPATFRGASVRRVGQPRAWDRATAQVRWRGTGVAGHGWLQVKAGARPVPVLPQGAVVGDGVLVVSADRLTVTPRAIVTGRTVYDFVTVVSGLGAGEDVVGSGAALYEAERHLRVIARIATWSARHARAVLVASALVVGAGELARRSLAQDALTDVSEPRLGLVVEWPGHPAADVARQVTARLAFEDVPGVRVVRASSMTGLAYLDLVFGDEAQLPRGRALVAERLARLSLPAGARTRLGPLATSAGWVLEYVLLSEDARQSPHGDGTGGVTLLTLRRLQDEVLRPALERVPGVAEVAALGGDRPQALIVAGAPFAEEAEAVRARLPALPEEARFTTAMSEGVADLNGRYPVVGGVVVAARGADPAAVTAGVRAALAAQRLPAGVSAVVVHDRSILARRLNATLGRALLEELAVVALVVLIFLLHGPSALVPIASLLVVLGLTFLALRVAGVPATVMSLGGIAIALGMAVDADVVALEAHHRGRHDLTPAIFTALVIAGLSFVPAFAFPGETGRLVRPLALGKTLVVAAATVVALVVSPALRRWLVRGRLRSEDDHPLMRVLLRAYRPVVAFALARPAFTLTTAALLAASCLPLLGRLGSEWMTRVDEGELLYMPTTSASVPPHLAAAELRRLDALLASRPEVAMVFGKLGRADTATDPAPCSMIEAIVRLRRPAAPGLVGELDRVMRSAGWSNAWTTPVRARLDMTATGVRTPLAVRVVSDRGAELAGEVQRVLRGLPGVRTSAPESAGEELVLRYRPDPPALARHQVSARLAEDTAALVLSGGFVGRGQRDGRAVDVRVLPDRVPRPIAELVREATVPGPDGSAVFLGALGRVENVVEPAVVRSEGGRAVTHVDVDLEEGTDLAGFVERASQSLAGVRLRPGEALEWTGQWELLAAGRRRLLVIVPLVLLSMLALLWWQFRSLVEALIVLGTVPLALVGSVWTLFLLGYPLSPPVWLGLISVVGLAMQTGVLMVVYLDEALAEAGPVDSRAAIVAAHTEGTVRRLRPKLMTILTMAAALLPLLWARGAGAEIAKRVAAPMVGGLLFSAFVTLEVIPVLSTMWRDRQRRRAG